MTVSEINDNDLVSQMRINIRKDLVEMMTSMDYQKVIEAGNILSRLCKDIATQGSLR